MKNFKNILVAVLMCSIVLVNQNVQTSEIEQSESESTNRGNYIKAALAGLGLAAYFGYNIRKVKQEPVVSINPAGKGLSLAQEGAEYSDLVLENFEYPVVSGFGELSYDASNIQDSSGDLHFDKIKIFYPKKGPFYSIENGMFEVLFSIKKEGVTTEDVNPVATSAGKEKTLIIYNPLSYYLDDNDFSRAASSFKQMHGFIDKKANNKNIINRDAKSAIKAEYVVKKNKLDEVFKQKKADISQDSPDDQKTILIEIYEDGYKKDLRKINEEEKIKLRQYKDAFGKIKDIVISAANQAMGQEFNLLKVRIIFLAKPFLNISKESDRSINLSFSTSERLSFVESLKATTAVQLLEEHLQIIKGQAAHIDDLIKNQVIKKYSDSLDGQSGKDFDTLFKGWNVGIPKFERAAANTINFYNQVVENVDGTYIYDTQNIKDAYDFLLRYHNEMFPLNYARRFLRWIGFGK